MFSSCSQRNTKEKSLSVLKDSIVKDSIRVAVSLPNLIDSCVCDSNAVKKFVRQKTFNSIAEYDIKSFNEKKFYELDSQANRTLWFRDIENPTATKFTELWDSYWYNNYYANPVDFVGFYRNKTDVPLAFIFGPNSDLWAYHIFVIKKVNCCYLITRSYFRHNRFTYKAFSVFDNTKLKELYSILSKINLTSIASTSSRGYSGYFMDNLSGNEFFIDFENEVIKSKDTSKLERKPKPEVSDLYNFVDDNFKWVKTYGK